MDYHNPVLKQACIEALNIKANGVYVDVTYGGGGHSALILEHLNAQGRLFGFDRDGDAIAHSAQHPQLTLIHENYSHLKRFLRLHGITAIDGLLADLGVSSHQFDQAERGFSTRFSGPLDGRMDQRETRTMADILNTYSPEELSRCFRDYGEIKNAYKLALRIAEQRTTAPLQHTDELISLLQSLAPKHKEHRYYAQVFQALRIEVNEELPAIDKMLQQAAEIMRPDGRLVVLSYHSLEDRIIKNHIRSGNMQGTLNKDFFGHVNKPWEAINRKPITATEQEIENNPRSRSAKLRIAKKIEIERK